MTPSRRPRSSPNSLRKSQRGIALIMVILVTAFLSALGAGLILAVFMDRLANRNMSGSLAMLFAADAAIELAARDLSHVDDWNAVLNGSLQSSFVDGAIGGVRAIPGGGVIDLTASTNMLNCGKAKNCKAAQMTANTHDRPWGSNNPHWQLYAFGPMREIADLSRPVPCYLAVWVADDGREDDGDPLSDGEPDTAGHGIVRVRAAAFGHAGSRRVIEAELARACRGAGVGACLPGIRVQSWREVRQSVP